MKVNYMNLPLIDTVVSHLKLIKTCEHLKSKAMSQRLTAANYINFKDMGI